jgi:hypothetical protein
VECPALLASGRWSTAPRDARDSSRHRGCACSPTSGSHEPFVQPTVGSPALPLGGRAASSCTFICGRSAADASAELCPG